MLCAVLWVGRNKDFGWILCLGKTKQCDMSTGNGRSVIQDWKCSEAYCYWVLGLASHRSGRANFSTLHRTVTGILMQSF